MTQALYDLLHACTVRITISKVSQQGTGFFVAPGTILTCAHVIQEALKSNAPIEIFWNNQTILAQIQEFRDASCSDLALLQVNLPNHPCILLHDNGIEPFGKLYTYGYTGGESDAASTTFFCEGWAGERQELLKFKLGRARPGMSGSPLLSMESGCVCSIMQSTFDRNIDLGGKALLSKVIFREFPALAVQQQQFHQQDRRWWNLLTRPQQQATELELPMQGGLGMPVEAQPTRAIKVVLSYSDDDKNLKEKLLKQLSGLRRQGFIKSWDNKQIAAGSQADEEIVKRINEADVILCLISPSFIDSNQCYEVEMEHALKRRKLGEAEVIPILLKAASWEKTPLHTLQVIPRSKKPIADHSNKEKILEEVAREIGKVINALLARKR